MRYSTAPGTAMSEKYLPLSATQLTRLSMVCTPSLGTFTPFGGLAFRR